MYLKYKDHLKDHLSPKFDCSFVLFISRVFKLICVFELSFIFQCFNSSTGIHVLNLILFTFLNVLNLILLFCIVHHPFHKVKIYGCVSVQRLHDASTWEFHLNPLSRCHMFMDYNPCDDRELRYSCWERDWKTMEPLLTQSRVKFHVWFELKTVLKLSLVPFHSLKSVSVVKSH